MATIQTTGAPQATIYRQPAITVPQTTGVPAPAVVTARGPAMTSTTVRKPIPPRAEPWEWIILIIIILLIIGVIIWMIWYFGFRSIGKPPGADCSANSDCEVDTYCSARGVCVPGEGDREGDRCDISSDCIIGLVCDPDTKVCTRSPSPLL